MYRPNFFNHHLFLKAILKVVMHRYANCGWRRFRLNGILSHRKHRYSRKFCLLLADVSLLSGADSLLAGRNPSVHGCSVSRQSFKQKSAGEHVRSPAILISFSRIYKSDWMAIRLMFNVQTAYINNNVIHWNFFRSFRLKWLNVFLFLKQKYK